MTRSVRYKVGSWIGAAALVTTGAAALSVSVAGVAGAVSVSTEAAFRTAWAASGTTVIDLTADVTLTCTGGEPTRNSSTAITVNGGRHTLHQTCAGDRVLDQQSTGTITLNQITISGATTDGGGGGVNTNGNVVVDQSDLAGNHADDEGGAIQTDDTGTVTVTDSAITNNTAGGSGGAIAAQGLITLVRTSVQGNTSAGNGGGFRAYGGATLIDSTLMDNTASGSGGGIDGGPITLVYATVVNNTGSSADNLQGGGLTAFGSVVALENGRPNCAGVGTVVSNGYNVDDDGSCGFGSGPGDQSSIAADLLLGAPADNGGFAQTRLPGLTSPLVDKIPLAACNAGMGIVEDQRLLVRPQGTACDIGAVEVDQGTRPTTTVAAGATTTTTAAGVTTTTVASTPATPVSAQPTFTG